MNKQVIHKASSIIRGFTSWLCGAKAFSHELGTTEDKEVTCANCKAKLNV